MKNILKKFLIGTFVALALMVASSALASYDFGPKTLKVGSTGQYVMTLQTLVGATPVDGSFGPITKAKVVAWQKAHSLIADGLFGPASKAKANETGTNFGAGCTNASGFSTVTGIACTSINANTFPVGCSNASGFSTVTGIACTSINANTFPVGCTNASGFSITTGYSCSTGLPHVIRSGGSSGGHHATAESDVATLKLTSTIKGVPLGEEGLGTSVETEPVLIPGAVVLTTEQAEDTLNTGLFITLFDKTDVKATVEVVKYDLIGEGFTPDNFDAHAPYNNEAIPVGGSVFDVRVTAEDGSVLYYWIVVGIEDDASLVSVADQTDGTPGGEPGDIDHAIAWEVTVPNTQATLVPEDISTAALSSVNLYSDATFDTEITGIGLSVLPLTSGGDTHAYIKVTAQDEGTTLYYDVTITRTANSDARLDFTALTGTSLDGVAVVNQTGAETGADEDNAMPLTVTIADTNAGAANFIPVTSYEDVRGVGAYVSNGTGGGVYAPVGDEAEYDFSALEGNTTLWIEVIAEDTTTKLYYKLTVTVLFPTDDILFALTNPLEDGADNTLTGEETYAVAVAVENTTASVVITATKTADQTIVSTGGVVVVANPTNPTYTVNTTEIADGGETTFTLIVSEDGHADIVYNVTVTVATPISDDATLKAASTIKGETIGSLGLGTPNIVLGSAVAGAVTISSTQAASTTNLTPYITLFDKNNANATVTRVVKYADEVVTTGFATDGVYTNGVITDQDFFIVEVTAQDGTTIIYYNIVVTVAAPAITTDSTIAKGASAPSVVVTGTDFDTAGDAGDLTIGLGTTGLTVNTVTFDSATQITIVFTGTAGGGNVTITAETSAFDPMAQAASNTLIVSVPLYALRNIGPAGGFIFYIDPIGAKLLPAGIAYLESAPRFATDPTKKWSANIETDIATGNAIGAGKPNTDAIVAALDGNETGTVAQLCSGLTSGGKSDWFLPSKNELALMYTNLVDTFALGGFRGDDSKYWSSSQHATDHTYALNEDFTDGSLGSAAKNSDSYFRCVRVVSGTDLSQIAPKAGVTFEVGPGPVTLTTITDLHDATGADVLADFTANDGTGYTFTLTNGDVDHTYDVTVTKVAESAALTIAANPTGGDDGFPYTLTITRVAGGQTWAIPVIATDTL